MMVDVANNNFFDAGLGIEGQILALICIIPTRTRSITISPSPMGIEIWTKWCITVAGSKLKWFWSQEFKFSKLDLLQGCCCATPTDYNCWWWLVIFHAYNFWRSQYNKKFDSSDCTCYWLILHDLCFTTSQNISSFGVLVVSITINNHTVLYSPK